MRHHAIAACVVLALAAQPAWAALEPTAAGLWQSMDDTTGKPDALIRIDLQNGKLSGRVEKLIRSAGEESNPLCDQCTGAQRDMPVVGMTILSNMTRTGNTYAGGTILDPENGQRYRCTMTLSDDGARLQVRGFIGAPLFGRTQTWIRQREGR